VRNNCNYIIALSTKIQIFSPCGAINVVAVISLWVWIYLSHVRLLRTLVVCVKQLVHKFLRPVLSAYSIPLSCIRTSSPSFSKLSHSAPRSQSAPLSYYHGPQMLSYQPKHSLHGVTMLFHGIFAQAQQAQSRQKGKHRWRDICLALARSGQSLMSQEEVIPGARWWGHRESTQCF